MESWEEVFISKSDEDNIILSLSDYSELQGYIYNLSEDNLKNNMHITISDFWNSGCKNGCNKLQSQLFNECVFSIINKTHYYSILKLVSVVPNLNRSTNDNAEAMEAYIIYNSDSCFTCLHN